MHQDSTYNHVYKNSSHIILYNHTDINHDSIFALNYMHFHSIHIQTGTTHSDLKILFGLFRTIYITFISTYSKWIIKRFIRVFIDECCSSLIWLINQRDTFFMLYQMVHQDFLLCKRLINSSIKIFKNKLKLCFMLYLFIKYL